MSRSVARKAIVHGRVQGVWYRASTAERAASLGLRGHARNMPDGTVEVVAAGDPESVDELLQWLWQGPPLARVTRVVVEDLGTANVGEGFDTR